MGMPSIRSARKPAEHVNSLRLQARCSLMPTEHTRMSLSGLSLLACKQRGEGHCWRMHREGPPGHRIRPEGLRIGSPQLTAGHGRPVCQPWWNGEKAEGQHLEAMPFTGSIPV